MQDCDHECTADWQDILHDYQKNRHSYWQYEHAGKLILHN